MAVIVPCCASCTDREKKIRELFTTEIVFPDSIPLREYTIFRYIHPKSCSSCELKVGRWRVTSTTYINQPNRIKNIGFGYVT